MIWGGGEFFSLAKQTILILAHRPHVDLYMYFLANLLVIFFLAGGVVKKKILILPERPPGS